MPLVPQRICFLIYPGFELLDYAGPMSVFASANRLRSEGDCGRQPLYELVTLSAQGMAERSPRYPIVSRVRPE